MQMKKKEEHLVNHYCLACHAGHVASCAYLTRFLQDVNVADGFIFYTVGALGHTINHEKQSATLHL